MPLVVNTFLILILKISYSVSFVLIIIQKNGTYTIHPYSPSGPLTVWNVHQSIIHGSQISGLLAELRIRLLNGIQHSKKLDPDPDSDAQTFDNVKNFSYFLQI